MYIIEKWIKDTLHAAGIDIGRVKPKNDPFYHIVKALENFNVDLVLDIGANTGQFAATLRAAGYQGDIVSFEPLSSAYKILLENAAADKRWKIHARGAIGSRNGEMQINIAGNSVSSSLLPMLNAHSSVAKDSVYSGAESTPVYTLDSLAGEYLKSAKNPFLKIDTQGYEWEVLDGAREILPHIRGILCEMSLTPLYENQRLWQDVVTRLQEQGFALWAIQRGFTDLSNGRTLQMDGMFFRL